MMDWVFLIKFVASTLVLGLTTSWLVNWFVIPSQRDLDDIALKEQSNVASVRKTNETAVYRNFLVPAGFPLSTGLGLSNNYKIRNGNFGDVWNAIMEISKGGSNYIQFGDKEYKLSEINGIAKHLLTTELFQKKLSIGLCVSPLTFHGFILYLASMMATIQNGTVPHVLSSIPRKKTNDVDILIIDSRKTYDKLNGSQEWYKNIIICDGESYDKDLNLIALDTLLDGYSNSDDFKYATPADNKDDHKDFLHITSEFQRTTIFNQMNLVSSMASFIKSFPSNHELSSEDTICVIREIQTKDLNLQIWPKVLSVLLHGGSVKFLDNSAISKSPELLQSVTLLQSTPFSLTQLTKFLFKSNNGIWNKMKLSWSRTLFSEGIFTKLSQVNSLTVKSLRCIFLTESVTAYDELSSFSDNIPKRRSPQLQNSLSSRDLTEVRAQFGTRVINEFYCPYMVLGPVASTNFYDYRVFPSNVDDLVTSVGPLSTSLEGKLISTKSNSDLDVERRQGMLCVRGFIIGRPLESKRLEQAAKLADTIAGGEGWMPLLGVYGLWGQDGCLYLYK